METIKHKKDFDCVEMKNAIQAKIYAETKDMSYEELRATAREKSTCTCGVFFVHLHEIAPENL
jgi:hypothetical protein